MKKLYYLRKQHQLTIRKLAEHLHCDYSVYSKYERGGREVPLYILIALADFFETNLDFLLGRTDFSKKLPEPRRKK